MVSLAEYLQNPCAELSVPYWKAKALSVPEDRIIIHDRDFSAVYLETYRDDRYFRLKHDLKNTFRQKLDGFEMITASEKDINTIVSIINQSYSYLQVSAAQIKEYTETPVYMRDLWILVREIETGRCVGCGMADFDREAGEAILEWIQVLPLYRNRKLGQAIVNDLLDRAGLFADFATVSGKKDDPVNPEALYRKCGFTGSDIWHVLKKR